MIRGKWKHCRVVEVYPDNKGIIRDVKIVITSPGKLIKLGKSDEEFDMIRTKANNLVIFGPEEDTVNNDDRGHGRVCKIGQKAAAICL